MVERGVDGAQEDHRGPGGGGIGEPIGTAVVLVRLYDGNFQFGSAHEDGSDLRFIAADDKTPLKFHFERYDNPVSEAYAWVKVPDVKPGAPHHLLALFGNAGEPAAAGAADAKTTYDPDTLLAWHFSETGAPPADATGQGHNAEGAGLPVTSSVIAGGLRLTGLNGLTLPAAPDLVWIGGSPATVSLWIKPTTLTANAALLSRRENDKSFVLGVDNGTPYVEIDGQRAAATAPLEVNAWKHLAVTAEGAKTTLWVDGAVAATLAAGLPTLNAPFVLGKDKAADATPSMNFRLPKCAPRGLAEARRAQSGRWRTGEEARGPAARTRPPRTAAKARSPSISR